MVTINSIGSSDPIEVAKGGTGAATLTGVLTGNGTSTFTVSTITDNYVIRGSTSNTVQDSTMYVTDAGEMTNTSQPCFSAKAGTQNNVTGDSTLYTVTFTAGTIFDQNSDFDGTSTFTSPVTGKYFLNTNVLVGGITAGMTPASCSIVTSNNTYLEHQHSAVNCAGNTQETFHASVLADMDAADTAIVQILISNATKVADVVAANTRSQFQGCLLC